jgi:ribosomal protein S18 acetylase RimI-like enzyme
MLLEMTAGQIYLPDAPSIDGLTFRLLRDESDYTHIVDLLNTCSVADGVEEHVTVEWATNFFTHITDFDPRRDILFAVIGDRPVGWVRSWVRRLDDGRRVYPINGAVLPQWRRRGIGRTLHDWAERHLRERAASQPADEPRVFRSFAAETEVGTIALLSTAGYEAVRYGFEMTRSFAEPIPDLPLPAGLEVRSVKPEQYRQVIAALNEAFRDLWSHSEMTDVDFKRWSHDPNFQPQLWQVAWAGDEVAGMVLNFIDREYNEEFKRLRGWTDPIGVRRPWRKQGLAKALIVRSMRLLQEQGMTEAGLGVDAQNPNGALRLYESLGFRAVKQFTTFEKPMD